jgi:hypothetical protein
LERIQHQCIPELLAQSLPQLAADHPVVTEARAVAITATATEMAEATAATDKAAATVTPAEAKHKAGQLMAKYKRSQLLIEPSVQRTLIRHAIGYWLCCALTLEFLNLAWQISTGPEQRSFWAYLLSQSLLESCVRLALGTTLVLPFVIWDMLKLSNRFAGPIYRMRRALREVAEHGRTGTVHLRKDDFWHELAEELNAALATLESRADSATGQFDRDEQQLTAAGR